ncbi:MAG: family 10 glycosylhydrolase [Candidatus Sericytochromatia bacterium]|nr:family 10 glycosylhydrolase [Candidatus Tanganyikabacteria bacterium]
MWTFRVRSYDERNDFGNPVLSRLPGLAARSENTGKPRFLSPAAPGAREFVLRTVSDLVDRYDVDGLFLDYVRYDEETPDDWTSLTNYRLERLGADAPWGEVDKRDYQLWREEKVNRIVADISALFRAKPRTLALSAATFRGEAYTRKTKLQNWRHWADNAWLTYTTSMLYSDDPRELVGWITQETDGGKRPHLFYPILGIHRMEDPGRALLEQLRAVRQQGQAGVFIFALGHLPKSLLADLARGPFRTPAVPPHRNPLGAARQVLRQLGDQFFPRQATTGDWATVAAARVLGSEVASVVRSMPAGPPYFQGPALVERLNGLHEVASRLERVNPGFQSEVTARLRYAAALVRAHTQRTEATRYVPPTVPHFDTATGNAKPDRP